MSFKTDGFQCNINIGHKKRPFIKEPFNLMLV